MAKKKQPKVSASVIIAGIAGLTILELYALFCGIDGVVFTAVIGIIALAIGVTLPNPIK
jgi:hypothetical protein